MLIHFIDWNTIAQKADNRAGYILVQTNKAWSIKNNVIFIGY